MGNNEITYFIYVRKSTESDGRQVLSIPAQIEEAEKLQLQERLVAIKTFTDSGSAKKPFNRPSYTDMIRRIKKGEAQGIIVWKIDRLARNHLEGGELIHLLQTGIIQSIWTPGREYQSKDSALLISLEASMASQYSVDLSQNVKRGLDKKLTMGQPPTIAPPGYSNSKRIESGSNSILIDEERWPIMRKAFDMALSGQFTIAKIAHILNNEFNFRTRTSKARLGSPISVSMLHRALKNPFYAGYFKYRGALHKGTYRPMISLDEHDRINKMLSRKIVGKPHRHEFAFTGLMTCGCCGCAITASVKLKTIVSTGEYRAYTFYHCTKRKGAPSCSEKRYTTKKEMETMIETELSKIKLEPKFKDWIIATIKENTEEDLQKHQALLKTIKEQEHKISSELDSLLDLRISKEISAEKYNEKKTERELVLMRVKERRAHVEGNVRFWLGQFSETLDFAVTALQKFIEGDPDTQKSICRYIGWNWKLMGNKVSFTRYKWFYYLQDITNHFDQEKERLEPVKTFEEYRQTDVFKTVYPYLSRLCDYFRTEATSNKHTKYSNIDSFTSNNFAKSSDLPLKDIQDL